MAIESVLVPVAAGVVGVAVGIGASFVARHKPKRMPEGTEKDVWDHLQDITRERAEAQAKKRALHKAYAAGSIDEHGFVSKDAFYTKRLEDLDEEIDAAVRHLGDMYLPEEMAKRDAALREISDIALLAKQLEELKQQHSMVEQEKNSLYLQLAETEDDKKGHLAEKNQIQRKYNEDMEKLGEMAKRIEELEQSKQELQEEVIGIKSRDEKIRVLERENKVLRDGLTNAKSKLTETTRTLGVVSTVLNRHADEIEHSEGRGGENLKSLVQPNNPGIQNLVKAHRGPKEAFEFVRDKIAEVHPKTQATFWLAPDDVMRLNAADPDDKAIFLCSMLRALGQSASVGMVELQNGFRKAVVLMDDRVLDPDELREYGDFTGLSREEALGRYAFDGSRVKRLLFEFNDQAYQEHSK